MAILFSSREKVKNIIFFVVILVFSYLMMEPIIKPQYHRQLPVEPDDAIAYLQSAVMFDIWAHDASLYDSIIKKLEKDYQYESLENHKQKWVNYAWYFRNVTVYHPFHSVILASINIYFNDWIRSYKWGERLGILLIVISLIMYLSLAKDKLIASGSLIVISCLVFPGQGLHYMVPSTINYAVLFFTIVYLIKSRIINWHYLILILLLYGVHTSGLYFAAVLTGSSILFEAYSFKKTRKFEKRMLVILATSVFLIILLKSLTIFFPILKIPINYWDYSINYWDDVQKNVVGFYKSKYSILLLITIFSGFILIIKKGIVDRHSIIALSFCGLFLISFFYILPHNHGDVCRRFSIIAFILVLPFVIEKIIEIINKYLDNKILIYSIYTIATLVVLNYAFRAKNNLTEYLIGRGNYSFNDHLLISDYSDKVIFGFDNPVIYNFYLANGLETDKVDLLFANQKDKEIDLLVFTNRMYRDNSLVIKNLDSIQVINLTNRKVIVKTDSSLTVEAKSINSLIIKRLNDNSNSGRLNTLHFEGTTSNWEWNSDSLFIVKYTQSKNDTITIKNEYLRMFKNIKIVNDSSFASLARVIKN